MIVLPKIPAQCKDTMMVYILTSLTRIMVVTTALFALQINTGLAQIPLATPQVLPTPPQTCYIFKKDKLVAQSACDIDTQFDLNESASPTDTINVYLNY